MSTNGQQIKKESLITLFAKNVATPLCASADWLSWILFATFVFVCVVALLFRFQVLQTTATGFYATHDWQFWYSAWFLLVLSTVSPLIAVTKGRSGIPIGLLVSVAVFHLLTFIVISTLFLSSRYPNNPAAITALLAAFATVAMVGVGWVVQHHSSSRTSRRAHTFNVLMQSRLSKEYQEQLRERDKYFPARTPVTKADATLWYRQNFEEQLTAIKNPPAVAGVAVSQAVIDSQVFALTEKYQSLQAVKYVLNFYEFLCAGIKSCDLDEGLLYETLRDIAIGLLRDTEELIKAIKPKQELVFEHFLEIADDWKMRQGKTSA